MGVQMNLDTKSYQNETKELSRKTESYQWSKNRLFKEFRDYYWMLEEIYRLSWLDEEIVQKLTEIWYWYVVENHPEESRLKKKK